MEHVSGMNCPTRKGLNLKYGNFAIRNKRIKLLLNFHSVLDYCPVMSWFSSLYSDLQENDVLSASEKAEFVRDTPEVVLTVFWAGTGSSKASMSTQIQVFERYCSAIDISDLDGHVEMQEEEAKYTSQFKMSFDGCAITNGNLGMLFGAGLDGQAEQVVYRVDEFIRLHRRRVTLNLVGLSRGAVACLKLAKKLKYFDPLWLSVNLLAFDPVPGNFVTSAKFDIFKLTHAWANMDLTQCATVNHALILYPYEPLPNLAVHAPMVPIFPPGVAVYDVILGCHQGAMWNHGNVRSVLDCWISSSIIKNFLSSHKTSLDIKMIDIIFPTSDRDLLTSLIEENNNSSYSSRCTHSYNSNYIIRSPKTGDSGRYLNKLQFILESRGGLMNGLRDHWSVEPYFYQGEGIGESDDPQLTLRFEKPI